MRGGATPGGVRRRSGLGGVRAGRHANVAPGACGARSGPSRHIRTSGHPPGQCSNAASSRGTRGSGDQRPERRERERRGVAPVADRRRRRPGRLTAAVRYCAVFCTPSARPDQNGPARSATAVKARPLSATVTTVATTRSTTATPRSRPAVRPSGGHRQGRRGRDPAQHRRPAAHPVGDGADGDPAERAEDLGRGDQGARRCRRPVAVVDEPHQRERPHHELREHQQHRNAVDPGQEAVSCVRVRRRAVAVRSGRGGSSTMTRDRERGDAGSDASAPGARRRCRGGRRPPRS